MAMLDRRYRLKVKAGGCSGLSAQFSVEAAPLPGDSALDWNGLGLFLPAASCLLLDGYTIDFSEGVQDAGLTFRNPNAAAASCNSSGGHGAALAVATVAISSIVRKR